MDSGFVIYSLNLAEYRPPWHSCSNVEMNGCKLVGACVEAAPTQRIDQNRRMYFKGCHKL